MKRWALLLVGIFLSLFVAWSQIKPLPEIEAIALYQKDLRGSKTDFILDKSASQFIRIGNNNLGIENDSETVRPMASTSKLILAYLVLQEKPLSDENIITFNSTDVNRTQVMASQSQSYLPILSGQSLNQYQALEALLMISANNVALKLAEWAYGSEEEYINKANSYLKEQGFKSTNIADASGFSPQTKSSSKELAEISHLVLRDPIIRKIVGQKTSQIANYGTIRNTNSVLGINSIDGAKTGFTGAAGGCFVYSASIKNVEVVGSILGAGNRALALSESLKNTKLIAENINDYTVLYKGQPLLYIKKPWRDQETVTLDREITINRWSTEQPRVNLSFNLGNKNQLILEIESSVEKKKEIIDVNQMSSEPSRLWRLLNAI